VERRSCHWLSEPSGHFTLGIRPHGERSQCGAGSRYPTREPSTAVLCGDCARRDGSKPVKWLLKLTSTSIFTRGRHPATHWLRSPVDSSRMVDARGSLSQWHFPIHQRTSSRHALAPFAGRFPADGGRTRLAQPVARGAGRSVPGPRTCWTRSCVPRGRAVTNVSPAEKPAAAPASIAAPRMRSKMCAFSAGNCER